ncbi:MAG: acyltransferase family protein [Bacillota bacterium]
MYFVIVVLQFYFLIPLFRLLLNTARHSHGRLLLLGLVLYLALTAWYFYWPPPSEAVLGALAEVRINLLHSWFYFFLLGAVTAVHWGPVTAWRRQHAGLVRAVFMATLLGITAEAIWNFTINRAYIGFLTTPLRPAAVLYGVGALPFLYLTTNDWLARGRPVVAALNRIGQVSFAMFLVHPLVMAVAEQA